MPTVFAMTVSTGAIKKPASTRGTTSLRIGSVPSARSALIWSVTTIDPSSAAMPDPMRPDSISAVSTGPSSLIIDALTSRPTTGRAPNWSSVSPLCSASEKAGEQHHRQRSDADRVELLDDVMAVDRRADDAAKRRGDEVHVFLHLERGFFESAVDVREHAAVRPSAPAVRAPARGC